MAVAFLVDLIKNFIDLLLRKVWGFCVGLCFGFIKQFLFYFFPFCGLWIKKVIEPIEKIVDPSLPSKPFRMKKIKR